MFTNWSHYPSHTKNETLVRVKYFGDWRLTDYFNSDQRH